VKIHGFKKEYSSESFEQSGPQKIKVIIESPTKEYYLGDAIPLTIRLFNVSAETLKVKIPFASYDFWGSLIAPDTVYSLNTQTPENYRTIAREADSRKEDLIYRNEQIVLQIPNIFEFFPFLKTKRKYHSGTHSLFLHYYGLGFTPKSASELPYASDFKDRAGNKEYLAKLWPSSDTIQIILKEKK
jgi:hypothetical protein